MKRILTSLPLTILLIGCGASDSGDVTANTTAASDTNSTTTTTTTTTTDASNGSTTASADGGDKGDASQGGADTSKDTATTGAANSEYKVVEESQPGMPPEVVAALKKVAVPPPPAKTKAPDKARIRIVTSKGPITVELNGKAAPLHVKSFLYLAQRGFYNGTVFHRYEPGFVIQGGDPLTKMPEMQEYFGIGGPGYQVPREFNNLKHDAMVFSMARSQDPDSAGSQFYITLDPAPHLDEGYTAFGKVTEGQNTVLKLCKGDTLKSITVLK